MIFDPTRFDNDNDRVLYLVNAIRDRRDKFVQLVKNDQDCCELEGELNSLLYYLRFYEGRTASMPDFDVPDPDPADPKYTVTYQDTDATSGTAPSAQQVTQGNALTVAGPSDLVRTNYNFEGWSTSQGGSVEYNAGDSLTPTSDMILYPVWAQINMYTITYDANGTSYNMPSQSQPIPPGTNVTLEVASDPPTEPVWNTEPDGSGSQYSGGDSLTMPARDVTLYAIWTGNFTVTYHPGNAETGSVPTDNNSYQVGDSVTVLGNSGNLTRSGYNFDGWASHIGIANANYFPGDVFQMGATNVNFYARWSEVSQPIPEPSGKLINFREENTAGSTPEYQLRMKTYSNFQLTGLVLQFSSTVNYDAMSNLNNIVSPGWNVTVNPNNNTVALSASASAAKSSPSGFTPLLNLESTNNIATISQLSGIKDGETTSSSIDVSNAGLTVV